MSSASVRFMLVNANDEIFRLSHARLKRMLSRASRETLPEFGGQRVRAAEAVVQLENRRPMCVARIIFHYLHFDKQGILDYERFMRDEMTVIEAGIPDFHLKPDDPKVIQAGQRFAARRLDHSFWWRPDPQLREAIMQAVLDRGKYRRL